MENERHAEAPDFGTLLRRYRRAAGLSQEGLAERALMSADGIGALERGHRRVPQSETVARLASALVLDDEERRAFAAAAGLRPGRLPHAAAPSGRWPTKSTCGLPFALTSFFGRESELEEILALVRDRRLVTLTGPGGTGKTQTALRVASRLGEDLGVVWFVGLAPIPDRALVVPGIASALGVAQMSDRPWLDTLTAAIKNRGRMLLVLDNCEHVLAEAGRVAYALLLNAPQFRILATSREPLKAAGEYAYRLPPLAERDARALFGDRARAVDHRFTLTRENEPVVGEICRRLDGMPLAIELAAARVNVLPVKAIAAQLKDRFRVLTGGDRTAEPRRRTLRAAIDWSRDLLSTRERRVFDRLCVFAGDCTLEAVQAVCADRGIPAATILDLIGSLVDKSLVLADLSGSAPRYDMLESFREYGRERLVASGELDAVKHRHARYYFEFVTRLSRIRASAEETWVAHIVRERPNVRAVLQWALLERGDVELGQRLVGLLARDKAFSQQYFWAEAAVALIDAQTPTDVRAMLAHAQAYVAKWRWEFGAELENSRRADQLYREVGDVYGSLKVQELIGHALLSLGYVDEAGRVFQEALAPAREQNDPILVGDILRALSGVYGKRGDMTAARGYAEEAIAVFEGAGASIHAVYALEDLAECVFLAGRDPTSARQIALRHLAESHSKNQEGSAAIAHNALAVYEIALAEYDEAGENAREALKYARTTSNNVMVAWSLQHFAAIAALRPRAATDDAPATYMQTARITGYIDAALTALRAGQLYTQHEEHARTLAALRGALGSELLEKLRAEGAALTEDEAVENAMALMNASGRSDLQGG